MVFDWLLHHWKLLLFAFLHPQLPARSRFLPFSRSTSFACSIVANPPEGTGALVIVIRGPSFFHPIVKSACKTSTGKFETAQQRSVFWLRAHRCVYDFGSRSFLPNRAFLVKRFSRTQALLQPWTRCQQTAARNHQQQAQVSMPGTCCTLGIFGIKATDKRFSFPGISWRGGVFGFSSFPLCVPSAPN